MSYFSETLTSLRKMHGLTQQQLADKTGLTRSAVGMYETAKREPDFATLKKFADFYHTDMNTLLTGSDNSDNSELAELLELLRRREDMRMLFKLAKDATPADVRSAVKIIEALRND